MKISLNHRMLFILIALNIAGENYYTQTVTETTESQEVAKTGELVNRRVLILDFVNSNDSKGFEYLETTIPDTFLSPLTQTKSFELMSRSVWQEILYSGKQHKRDAYDENIAIATGKSHGADVVIMGNFTVTNDTAIVNVHVIDISNGQTIISKVKTAKNDGSLFSNLNELALELSREMNEKLPPLPQQLITKERVKYLTVYEEKKEISKPKAKAVPIAEKPADKPDFAWNHKKIIISFSQGFDIDVLNSSNYGLGMLGSAGFNASYFLENQLYFGIALGLNQIFSATSVIGKIPVMDPSAFVGYSVSAKQWLFTADVGAGLYLMPIGTVLMYNPVLNFNLGSQVLVSKHFSLGLKVNAQMYYDQPSPLVFGGIGLMLGYIL